MKGAAGFLAAAWLLIAAAAPALAAPATEEAAKEGMVARYLLQAPDGRILTNTDFPGRLQLITFGYTYCPDVCPTTLASVSQVLKLLGDQAGRVQALFITVDPERDTLAVLRRYTEFFDPRILGLTGSPELVRAAADHFQVSYSKHLEPGQPADRYAVDHTAGLFVLGPDGEYLARFAYTAPPEQVAGRLRALIADLPRSGKP